ncbi:MAG: hypothetical protein AB1757_08855 [Acidobacteriota bacterium]
MPNSIEFLLNQLEEAKRRFDDQSQTLIVKCLEKLSRSRFQDASTLIRFHEILLFLRAYPASAEILEQAETLLNNFVERVQRLYDDGADMAEFWDAEYSGIAGNEISAVFSYKIARFLAEQFPQSAEVDWQAFKRKDRLGAILPRLIPLLDEDASVEANVPYYTWLKTAKGQRGSDLAWMIRGFAELDLSERAKAELFDSLDLPIWWRIENAKASRTRLRLATKKFFYHTTPLIKRSEVSIADEFAGKPLRVKKLSSTQGKKAINLARVASVERYRELYGFTHGDANCVSHAELGRGVEMFIYELAPEWRLPLRAYHAGMIFKNGVPVGYVETLSLFERCEVGFNLYYTFRDGETAWLYARLLKLFHQLFGVTYFSIDPYQIGFHNEEAIESGAFWFYRKLGFRSTQPGIRQLIEAEEKRLHERAGYRTPARTLRKIAAGHLVFELHKPESDWDGFQIRNLGLNLQKHIAKNFAGSAKKMKAVTIKEIARELRIQLASFSESEHRLFENFALVLALINDFHTWTPGEKQLLADIIEAKLQRSENDYLALQQKHSRLRDAVIRSGF